MTDLIFVDTETTGLAPDDDVWEFAAIRRHGSGADDTALHIQVHHDIVKANRLPSEFAADRSERFDRATAVRQSVAATRIHAFMHRDIYGKKPVMVGVNPAFDAMMVSCLLRRNSFHEPPWDYRIIDLPAVAIGVLTARGEFPALPAKSEDLAALTGLPVNDHTRHTAMGDARWSRDWWDAITSGRTNTSPAASDTSVDTAIDTLRRFAAATGYDEGVNIGTVDQLYRRAMGVKSGVADRLAVIAAGDVLRSAGVL